MTIDFKPLLFGLTGPLWAPADEGTPAGDDTTGGDEAEAPKGVTAVLGGDDVDDGKTGDDAGDADEAGTKDGDEGEKDERTDEEKAAEAKASEVPEDGAYEFDLPEGVELPDDKKESWSKQFAEMGLTRGQAQRLIEAQGAEVVEEQKAYAKFLEDQQKDHLEAAKADKDIGGDKWAESTKLANSALQVLRGGPKAGKNADGTPREGKPEGALEALILTSGNGNNPEIIRELRRIGELTANDRFAGGNTHEEPVPTEQKWYGGTTPATKRG